MYNIEGKLSSRIPFKSPVPISIFAFWMYTYPPVLVLVKIYIFDAVSEILKVHFYGPINRQCNMGPFDVAAAKEFFRKRAYIFLLPQDLGSIKNVDVAILDIIKWHLMPGGGVKYGKFNRTLKLHRVIKFGECRRYWWLEGWGEKGDHCLLMEVFFMAKLV